MTWDGESILPPQIKDLILFWEPEVSPTVLGPISKRRASRPFIENDPVGHALCPLFPAYLCEDDLDEENGGTGDWHRLLAVLHDTLYGSPTMTGLMDDVQGLLSLRDISEMTENFLDASLLHLGFTLNVPLTVKQKRNLLRTLIPLYRLTGTDVGIGRSITQLLGIQARIISLNGPYFSWLQCGIAPTTSLSAVVTGSTYVEVLKPENFVVGNTIRIIDDTAPFVEFEDTEITAIVSNRIYFAPQTLTGTIEAGAIVSCDKFTSRLGEYKLGPNVYDPEDSALYTFFVDIEKTVETTTDIEDGDSAVTLDDTTFITTGSRVKIVDGTAPLADELVVTVTSVDHDTGIIDFSPVSLVATIEAGAQARNIFTQSEIDLIDLVVASFKASSTHHYITRDGGADLAEVG